MPSEVPDTDFRKSMHSRYHFHPYPSGNCGSPPPLTVPVQPDHPDRSDTDYRQMQNTTDTDCHPIR